MARFRCPECNVESEVSARNGHEVVALYCLRHTGGADSHTRPVYMPCVEPSAAAGAAQVQARRPGAREQVQRRAARSRTERCVVGEAGVEPATSSV
jgi:hypothetical protein